MFDKNACEEWVTDSVTNEVFNFSTGYGAWVGKGDHSSTLEWVSGGFLEEIINLKLNCEELRYINIHIFLYFKERKEKMDSILLQRENRADIRNRERLTQIYK